MSTSSARDGLPGTADQLDPEASGRLVAWVATIASGRARPDEAAARLEEDTDGHVAGAGGGGDRSEVPIADALGWLEGAEIRAVTLVLPIAGDPLGCSAAGAFTQAAILAEQGVAIDSAAGQFGWVPEIDRRGSSYCGVLWRAYAGSAAAPPVNIAPERIIEQADRALRRALREATELLGTLDLAQWRTEAAAGRAAADAAVRSRLRGLPPDWPPAARELGARALALWRVLRIASADSAAVSASGAIARAQALRPVSRAVRESAMVAFNVPAAMLLASRGPNR